MDTYTTMSKRYRFTKRLYCPARDGVAVFLYNSAGAGKDTGNLPISQGAAAGQGNSCFFPLAHKWRSPSQTASGIKLTNVEVWSSVYVVAAYDVFRIYTDALRTCGNPVKIFN